MNIINTSIVVTGEEHNPTILHPSFLSKVGIVSPDWEPADKGVVCTPAFSEVRYKNAIVFTVEPNRLQVKDEKPPQPVTKSLVAELAIKYVEALPHVPFKAVGINFAAGVEKVDPAPWIIERFLKAGRWNSKEFAVENLALKVTFSENSHKANVTISPGQFKSDDRNYIGIVITANYHRNISEADSLGGTKQAISMFDEKFAHFERVVEVLIR